MKGIFINMTIRLTVSTLWIGHHSTEGFNTAVEREYVLLGSK